MRALWSKEDAMYNLLMQYAPWEEGHQRFAVDRLFEYTTPQLINSFGGSQNPNLAELEKLPVLFAREEGPGDREARTGRILRPHMVSAQQIEFEVLFDRLPGPISQTDILRLAPRLQINNQGRGITEFNRTHWAVKDVDLFQVLMNGLAPQSREISVFRVSPIPSVNENQLSAMMPFAGFGAVYAAIQNAALANGMTCNRADDIWENATIIQDIVDLIDRSAIVVCDCTSRNPNVFYEIGIAHTLGKEVILITQSADDIPFDLRHLRYIRYYPNDMHQLSIDISNKIQSIRNR